MKQPWPNWPGLFVWAKPGLVAGVLLNVDGRNRKDFLRAAIVYAAVLGISPQTVMGKLKKQRSELPALCAACGARTGKRLTLVCGREAVVVRSKKGSAGSGGWKMRLRGR